MTDGWGSKVKWGDRHSLASVAGVSDRVIARKLEREQKKKKNVEGGGREEKRKRVLLKNKVILQIQG